MDRPTSVAYGATYGKFGQVVNFNGSTSKIETTISSGLSGSFAINAWINPSQLGIENAIAESHVSSYNNYWAYLTGTGSNKFLVNLYDGTHNPSLTGNTTYTTGTWYMVALVRDTSAGKLRLYVNGQEDGTAVTDTTTSVPSYSAFDVRPPHHCFCRYER